MKPSLASPEGQSPPRSSTRASRREQATAQLLELLALEKKIDAQIARLRERKAQTKVRIEAVRVKLAGKQLELTFAKKRRSAA